MKTVLSTKKLQANQRELLLNAGLSFVEYDAIEITFLEVDIPDNIQNAIFTSQNGVKSYLKNSKSSERNIKCFCVGEKTKLLLEDNGYKVEKMGTNSKELAHFIQKEHTNDKFYYFCGSKRRDELPDLFHESNMVLFELESYKTVLNLKKFDQKWDGILFFSPSGVQSYFEANSKSFEAIQQQNDNPLLVCIGETTASEAKKYSTNVAIANATSVESVIAKAVKMLKVSSAREA